MTIQNPNSGYAKLLADAEACNARLRKTGAVNGNGRPPSKNDLGGNHRPLQPRITEALKAGPMTSMDVANLVGSDTRSVRCALVGMVERGAAVRVREPHGLSRYVWRLPA